MNRNQFFSRVAAAVLPAIFARKLTADKPGVGGQSFQVEVTKPMFRSMGVEYLSAGRSTQPIALYNLIRHNETGDTYMVSRISTGVYQMDGHDEPLLVMVNTRTSHSMAMPKCWVDINFHVIGAAMPENTTQPSST